MTDKDRQFYRAFGVKLARARKKSKLKQEALAIAVGLSRTSITNIERGRQPVQFHLVIELAEILDVNLTMLMPDIVPAGVVPTLPQMDPTKRLWVERVLTRTVSVDSGARQHDGTVQPRKEESRRTTQSKNNR